MIKNEYVYHAIITNVVDGDTVDAIVDLGFTVSVNVRFRLNGINTMEIRDPDPIKREQGLKAKQFLSEQILDKLVTLKSYKTDKYGRWLADIYFNNEHVNNRLLLEGLAVPYMV